MARFIVLTQGSDGLYCQERPKRFGSPEEALEAAHKASGDNPIVIDLEAAITIQDKRV